MKSESAFFNMINNHADHAERMKLQRKLAAIDRECTDMAERLGKISQRRKK